MIVGNGMMAGAFSAYLADPDLLIFASGVSDSLEERREAFDREKDLLLRTLEQYRGKPVVYFGTCSVFDDERRATPYVQHKLAMERVLERSANPWMVLRLPLAIGPAHFSRTLAQFLHDRIARGEIFELWAHATRYPIDVADATRIATYFFARQEMWNRRINLALRAFRILDFVQSLERIVGKPARYTLVEKGSHYEVDCPEVKAAARHLQLDFSDDYLDRVLKKYFGTGQNASGSESA